MAGTQGKSTKASAAKGTKTNAKKNNATSSGRVRGGGSNNGDTVNAIKKFLFEMHEVGRESVPEEEVLKAANYKRADSTGYRVAMKTLTKELKHVEKLPDKTLKLTTEARESMSGSSAKPKTNEETEQFFKDKILKISDKVPQQKLDAIWNVLRDGQAHGQDELLNAADYKRPDSTGYREIMKWLNKMELIEKVGKGHKFTDKVFPFPRED